MIDDTEYISWKNLEEAISICRWPKENGDCWINAVYWKGKTLSNCQKPYYNRQEGRWAYMCLLAKKKG